MAQIAFGQDGAKHIMFPGGSITSQPVGRGQAGGTNAFDVQAAAVQQPGVFAGVLGNNYGAFTGGMAGLGKSYADAFGAYNLGLGNIATAKANEAGARYGANAMAEAARQQSLGTLGSASLGAYGSAANSALAAWAANQQAYNNALASMQNANQQGLSNYGTGRNTAIANLGNQYGSLGRASVLGNLNLQMGSDGMAGGGFGATGPDGGIASGTYGGGGGGSRLSMTGGGADMRPAYGALDQLRQDLMSSDVLDRMDSGNAMSMQSLNDQHASSRGMPSQMLGDTLQGLLTLGRPAYDSISQGMNQFYDNNRADFSMFDRLAGQMKDGFGTVGGQLKGVQGDIRSGYGTANQGVMDMWNQSLGNLPMFQSQAAVARRAAEARRQQQEEQRRALAESRAQRAARRGTPWWKA